MIASLDGRARARLGSVIAPGELHIAADVVNDQYAALEGANSLLILVRLEQFAMADFARLRQSMQRPLVIDGVGVLEGRQSEMQGIEYVSMGR